MQEEKYTPQQQEIIDQMNTPVKLCFHGGKAAKVKADKAAKPAKEKKAVVAKKPHDAVSRASEEARKAAKGKKK